MLLWVGSPLALGGAVPSATWLIASFSVLALISVLVAKIPLSASPATAVILAAPVWTLLQRLPLPRGLIEWLSPDRVAEVDATYSLLAEDTPAWIPLSMDPGGTEYALVLASAAACSWLVAGALARKRGRRFVYRALAWSSIALATITWMHLVSGSEQVWGFYSPTFAAPWPASPVMNANHLAALMAVGATLCLGLASTSEKRDVQVLWVVGALVTGAIIPLTRSRGGLLGLCVSLALLALVLLRSKTKRSRSTFVALGTGGVGLLCAFLYLGWSELAEKFQAADFTKVEVAAESLKVAASFPVLGIGRGAFSPVFSRVMGGSAVRFDHPENFVAEWAIEWGIPFALLLIVVLGNALVRALLKTRSETAIAAAAIAGLMVHELFDYSLELSGALVVAAGLGGATLLSRRTELPSAAGIAIAILGLVSIAAGVSRSANLPGPAGRLAQTELQASDDLDLDALVSRHPLEPSFVLLGAWQRQRENAPNTGRWLNRAIELAPRWSEPHLLAARTLWRTGRRTQAALEAREAETLRPGAAVRDVCQWIASESDIRLARLAAPRHRDRAAVFYDRLVRCLPPTHALRAPLDARIRLLSPHLPGPSIRHATTLEVPDRIVTLRSALGRLEVDDPQRLEVAVRLADVLVRAGESIQAARLLDDEVPASSRRESRWVEARARAAIIAGDTPTAERFLAQLRGLAGGSAREIARARRIEARFREEADDLAGALASLEEANRIHPNLATIREIARLAGSLGRRGLAGRAWQQACEESGAVTDCRHTTSNH